jgi:hypothetical protein
MSFSPLETCDAPVGQGYKGAVPYSYTNEIFQTWTSTNPTTFSGPVNINGNPVMLTANIHVNEVIVSSSVQMSPELMSHPFKFKESQTSSVGYFYMNRICINNLTVIPAIPDVYLGQKPTCVDQ